jgi:hypothetical protein
MSGESNEGGYQGVISRADDAVGFFEWPHPIHRRWIELPCKGV